MKGPLEAHSEEKKKIYSHMISINLLLSSNILAFFSNHINHIKERQPPMKIFAFRRLPKMLKKIPNILVMAPGGNQSRLAIQSNFVPKF